MKPVKNVKNVGNVEKVSDRSPLDIPQSEIVNHHVEVSAKQLTVHFRHETALRDISLEVSKGEILSIIGPARSGKTTFLRVVNRLVDLEPDYRISGLVEVGGRSVYHEDVEVAELRKQVGMVFSVPTPLRMTIFDNIVFGPRLSGRSERELPVLVERTLKAAYLWEEVKDRLGESALNLSGGQQQRLCLARTLALDPSVLLLDEPCSGLDPISTAKIEEALQLLKSSMAIVLVTNNVKQAARASDRTAFLLMGELVENASTADVFTTPKDSRTEAYITGRFG